MIVEVERCSNYFRLTLPCGSREFVSYDNEDCYWNRSYASEALNIAEFVYGLNRRSVRFRHTN